MKSILKNIIFITFIIVITVIRPPSVHAEIIRGYDVQITLQKDGKIHITEKIDYDFETAYKHGIYRDIRVIKKNSDGKEYELTAQVANVVDGAGVAYNHSQSRVNDKLSVKIGDANRTITGLHRYVINYIVSGAISYFSDHDELYWSGTGNDWEVEIENVNTTVRFPEGLKMDTVKVICYSGPEGSKTQDCSIVPEQNSVSVKAQQLAAGSGLTVIVSFSKGFIAVLEPKPYTAFENTTLGKIIFFVIFLVVGIGAFIWYFGLPFYIPIKWYLSGRDPRSQDVRVWYDPPQTKQGRKLTAAETGALLDEKVDAKDVFGSLIQLAEAGYFSIKEEKKGELTFMKGKPQGVELLPFEKKLLTGIFKEGKAVRVKDVQIADEMQQVSDSLYTQVVQDGFFPESPEAVRTRYYVVAGIALFTGNFFLAMIAFLFGRNMPRKTELGAQQASIGKSLKTFLSSQEKQLEFQAQNQMMFEKLLPYAIAFGVEKIWANRFKDIALTNPSWYSGYDNSLFNAVYFTNTMHRSVGTFTSSVTPTHSSSGFSSGFSGGFSGGGGGGGGGGSW